MPTTNIGHYLPLVPIGNINIAIVWHHNILFDTGKTDFGINLAVKEFKKQGNGHSLWQGIAEEHFSNESANKIKAPRTGSTGVYNCFWQ